MSGPRGAELPGPYRIAERYAAVTGETDILPSAHPLALNAIRPFYAAYPFDGRPSVGLAVRYPASTLDIICPIGQYDAAYRSWRFAPEYVAPTESEPLAQLFQASIEDVRLSMREIAAAGHAVIDTFDFNTHLARRQAANYMTRWNFLAFASRSAVHAQLSQPTEVVAADAYTLCYPTLVSRYAKPDGTFLQDGEEPPMSWEGYVLKPDQSLALCFAGLKVAHPDQPGHTRREMRQAIVARRDATDPSLWWPDLNSVSVQDWESLRHLPGVLERARDAHPHFSVAHGAVAYNTI